MSLIDRVTEDTLSPEQRTRWEHAQATHGLTHMKQTLLRAPLAYDALMSWYPLRDALIPLIGERGTIVLSYAISTTNECVICSLYFRKALQARGEPLDGKPLSPDEEDLAEFGRQVARDGRAERDLITTLIERYGQPGVVLLTAFAGIMVATNIVNEVLDVDPDDAILGLITGDTDPVSAFPVLQRRNTPTTSTSEGGHAQ